MPSLEIIASTLDDALNAHAGGADSLELCVALEQDGLTPPLETIKEIRDKVNLPLNVLLRPHAKTFVYTQAEIDAMFAELEVLKAVGINTIVFGAHKQNGELEIALVKSFAEIAPLTLHRAIDSCSNPETALEALRKNLPRVLTSGGAASAWEGREKLKIWQARYGQDLDFAIASKITLENITVLAKTIGATEYHVGSAARTNGMVDIAKVCALKAALNS